LLKLDIYRMFLKYERIIFTGVYFVNKWGVENVNRSTLKKAGKVWVEKDIISAEQLNRILELYPTREPRILLTIFSILLISIGFLIFIFSDWAQVPHFSRILLVAVFMVGLYVAGYILYEKGQEILGITFLILGFVVFGAGLLLAINIYSIVLYSAWPFVLWSLMALVLFMLYEHHWMFSIGVTVTTIGQINSGIQFGSFNYLLIAILLLGFTHFAYHRQEKLFSYLIAISYSLQATIFMSAHNQEYYWLIVYFLMMYLISYLIKRELFANPIKNISLVSIFILGMFQTIILQDIFYFDLELRYSLLFLVLWIILFSSILALKLFKRDNASLANLVLFLPVFYLPFASIFSLIILFAFSLAWIILGYRKDIHFKVLIGSIAFLLSTFTAYVQYAWATMNKSLFFIIGGLMLLVMSMVIDRQRRLLQGQRGDER